jgi:hypothetical protein
MTTWLFFFFIDKLPAVLWLSLATLSVVLYFSTYLIMRFWQHNLYLTLIRALSVVTLCFSVFMFGGVKVNEHYIKMIKELETKVSIAEAKSQAVNTIIEERVEIRTEVIRDKQIVYRDRIIEIATEIDAQCVLDPEVLNIHNQAATYPFNTSVNIQSQGEQK